MLLPACATPRDSSWPNDQACENTRSLDHSLNAFEATCDDTELRVLFYNLKFCEEKPDYPNLLSAIMHLHLLAVSLSDISWRV